MGPKEIDGLLVPPGKAQVCAFTGKVVQENIYMYTYTPYWPMWVVIFEALFDVMMS